MFEGDLEEGELEIGQIAAIINHIQPAAKVVEEIWQEFLARGKQMNMMIDDNTL